jgi:hypothetical protein
VKLAGNFGKIAAGIGSPAEPQVRSGFDSFVEGAAFFAAQQVKMAQGQQRNCLLAWEAIRMSAAMDQ